MSHYSPLEGVVTSIATYPASGGSISPCSLTLTLRSYYGDIYTVILHPSTYVLNQSPIRQGDTVIAFYDTEAPMPLIYPPQYQAAVVLEPAYGQYAMLDTFDQNLQNSEGTLRLNLGNRTDIRTQNGQMDQGVLAGHLLLVLYGKTTRSIPAQTTPDEIIVFCRI